MKFEAWFSKINNNRLYQNTQWLLWALLIVLLPITSLPLITRLAGGTMVGPASMIPLALLALVWWLPYLLLRGKMPWQSLPIVGFLLIATLSSLLSFFAQIPPFQTALVWRQVLEGFVTLMIGFTFYMVAASVPKNDQYMQFTLRLINWSGLAILIWSMIQGIAWMQLTRWPLWLREIQYVLSAGTLYKARITGFTYEPSWLAHQLNMLYLPLWLSASFQRISAHRFKVLGLSLENLLLAGGVVMLYLSKSRLGLLAFILCVAYLLFELSLKIVRWLQGKFTRKTAKRWAAIFFYLGLALLLVAMLVGTGFYLSKADPRMKEFFDLETLREKSFLEYAEKLAFSARIVYWQAGWDIFGKAPLLGVGLGNAGYYFYDELDPYAWELMEVRHYMYDFTSPPNIKSLWVRLLAETGIVGTVFWVVWLLLILLSAVAVRRKKHPLAKMVGLAGILTLLALLIDGFSLDTFALPYFWVSFGLVTAAFNSPELDTAPPSAPGKPG